MGSSKKHWGVLVLIVFIALFLAALLLPPLPRAKARASRVQTVNRIPSVTFTLPGTNALPTPTTNK